VQDNEGLGRKSSKRCCIFHKPRAFGESSSDSSDDDSVGSGSSSSSGGGFPSDRKPKNKNNRGPIARPKQAKQVPAYQRFHA
jgi:protein phosphatase 1 regulatory subunit 11